MPVWTSAPVERGGRPVPWRRGAVAVVLIPLLALVGCGGESSDEPAAADSLTVTPGTLTIGSDLTYPPYAYFEGDTPSGLDPDLGRALAEQMGLEPEFVDTRFAQLIPGLQANRFDAIMSALYITRERAEVLDYVPYFTTGTSIIVPAGGDFQPKIPSDLCGKRVASIRGSAILPDLQGPVSDECRASGDDPLQILEFPTDPEATQALLSGQADVHLTDAAVAKAAVESAGGETEISSEELLYPIAVGIGIPKGDEALLEALEGALEELKSSGEYEGLLDEYNVQPPDPALVEEALGEESAG